MEQERPQEEQRIRFREPREPTQTVASVVPVWVAKCIAERARKEGVKPSAVMRDVLVREFGEQESTAA